MRTIGVTALAMLTGGAALAADLPIKAPVYKAPTAVTWSGFYAGGNIGYAWSRFRGSATSAPAAAGDGVLPPLAGGFGSADGVLGGGQIGFNWQLQPNLIAGVEADIQGIDARRRRNTAGLFDVFTGNFLGGTEITGVTTVATEARLSWFGTVRGRLGYASNNWLLFATGGLAYGRVHTSANVTSAGFINCFGQGCIGFLAPIPVAVAGSAGDAQTRYGWTAGGGLEAMLWQNWSAKAEYLHVDLGSLNAAGAVIASRVRVTEDIARLGLNYHFTPF